LEEGLGTRRKNNKPAKAVLKKNGFFIYKKAESLAFRFV
jgi:hypothetical protein